MIWRRPMVNLSNNRSLYDMTKLLPAGLYNNIIAIPWWKHNVEFFLSATHCVRGETCVQMWPLDRFFGFYFDEKRHRKNVQVTVQVKQRKTKKKNKTTQKENKAKESQTNPSMEDGRVGCRCIHRPAFPRHKAIYSNTTKKMFRCVRSVGGVQTLT